MAVRRSTHPGQIKMAMEKITSASNERVKYVASLQAKASVRNKEQAFVLEGLRLFSDTPAECIKEVYVTEAFLAGASPEVQNKIKKIGGCIVTEAVMAKMSDTKTPQGVLAVAARPVSTLADLLGHEGKPLVMILEDIQDPGNLGTIFRTAEAAGVTGILMSRGTVDATNPKVVRSTMSAIFREPFYVAEDLHAAIRELKEQGVRVYAAHLGGVRRYDQISYLGASAFLIGNEARGLLEDTASLADEKILIPMSGSIESLNAAMAAGILGYEAARQRWSNV